MNQSRSRQRPHSSYNRTTFSDTSGGPMPIQCQFCSGQTFRRSRLRAEDFWQVIRMRYPVRCLRCSQRQMVSFTVAGISLSSLTRHDRPVRAQQAWKNWTAPAGDGNSHTVAQPAPTDD
jgi:hypothetical protein